uniref:Uncharacterized protein n=1 Tax=Meloidogyne floridensis TaxID=298350 RepID=A0A915NPJ8_9BILA
EVFSLLPKLKHLDLSGNPVNSWSPHTFLGLSQIITKIDLSNVGLFSLPRLRSSSLEYLNLSNNFIYEIDPKEIEIFPSLLSLDLSGNRIVEINAQIFEKMPELKVLNISDNESLTIARLPQLVSLPSPHSWSNLKRLKELELHSLPPNISPQISKILQFLPPLHSLHFESREAEFTGSELELLDLRLLRKLTITGRSIRRISPNAFNNLRGFRLELTIEGTQLREFPIQSLQNIKGITFLRLNLLNNKQLNFFNSFGNFNWSPPFLNGYGTILEKLEIKQNSLFCDCKMAEWLFNWLEVRISSTEILTDKLMIDSLLMQSDCLIGDSSVLNQKLDKSIKNNHIGFKTISITNWINELRELAKASDFENFYEFCNNLNEKENSGTSNLINFKIFYFIILFISILRVINL